MAEFIFSKPAVLHAPENEPGPPLFLERKVSP